MRDSSRKYANRTIAVGAGTLPPVTTGLSPAGGGGGGGGGAPPARRWSDLEQDGDGPVARELDAHVGPEAAGGHLGAVPPQRLGHGVDQGCGVGAGRRRRP